MIWLDRKCAVCHGRPTDQAPAYGPLTVHGFCNRCGIPTIIVVRFHHTREAWQPYTARFTASGEK